MVWPAIISAGASLLGGAVSAFGQSRAQNRSEDFSREMYEYALTHGPSLEMQGLRAAGINPMLRYGSGGSSTPVTMPTMSFGNAYGSLGDAISGLGSSAFSALTAQQSIEESEQRVENLRTDLIKTGHEIHQVIANTSLTNQQRENAIADHGRILQEQLVQLAEIELREAQASQNYAAVRQAEATIALLTEQATNEGYRTIGIAFANEIARNQADLSQLDNSYWMSLPGRIARGIMLGREALGIGFGAGGVVGPASVHGRIGH